MKSVFFTFVSSNACPFCKKHIDSNLRLFLTTSECAECSTLIQKVTSLNDELTNVKKELENLQEELKGNAI